MATNSANHPLRCQLVVANSSDQVRLHGLHQIPVPVRDSTTAAVILHGLGGNFYNSKLNLRLAATFHELGVATVLANTRGHDGISMNTVAGRARTIGAAFEIVGQCKEDVEGWVQWLTRQGYQRVVLVGHSLGAIKSLYAQAHAAYQNVVAIVALSATRLSHAQFRHSAKADLFDKWYSQAEQLVAAGQGQTLMQVDFPFPTHISAATYVDKYGPEDRYDWLHFAQRIEIPVLLIFGELELRDNPAFHAMMQDVEPLVASLPNYTVTVIESADHYYSGVHHRAAEAVRNWISDQLGHQPAC